MSTKKKEPTTHDAGELQKHTAAAVETPMPQSADWVPVDHKMLEYMNLPPEFWCVHPTNATPSVSTVIDNYLARFDQFVSGAVGLFFFGQPGVGKTGAAATLLVAARRRRKTCQFYRVGELRRAIKDGTPFDDGQTVHDRALAVDVLVLDALTEADFTLPYFGYAEVLDLVTYRGQRRRTTFITSAVSEARMKALRPEFFETAGTYLTPVEVTGPSRRKEMQKKIASVLFEPRLGGSPGE